MSNITIKRLNQNGTEFVPITAAEAVVVKTSNIPGITQNTVTTLEKVLIAMANAIGAMSGQVDGLDGLLGQISQLNSTVEGLGSTVGGLTQNYQNLSDSKQDKITAANAGNGITITVDESGKPIFSLTNDFQLTKLVTQLPVASAETLNQIYIVPNQNGSNSNTCNEYVTVLQSDSSYVWELIGQLVTTSDLNLEDYVTKDYLEKNYVSIENAINAVSMKTSNGSDVIIDIDIPVNLYN